MLSLRSDAVDVLNQLGRDLISKPAIGKICEICLANVEKGREQGFDAEALLNVLSFCIG